MAPLRERILPLAVLLLAAALGLTHAKRKEPPPPLPAVVQALKPQGLRISVLDEEGMDLVIIHANINVPLEPKETGQITQTVFRSQDGFWTMEDASQELKPNDIVFYWIYASIREKGRNSVGRKIISEFVDPSCSPSITTVNGQAACRGALIFEDNFDTLNATVWKHNIQFSGDPDTDFTTYVPDEENSYVRDGILNLKPTAVLDDVQLTTPLKLEDCTWKYGGEDWCERKPLSWNILPPSRSAWLTSNTAFRFGRVEVRAKAAVGDWIQSKIFLDSRDREYGKAVFDSGRIELMRVRGNADLRRKSGGNNYGANQNRAHTAMGTCYLVFFDYWEKDLPTGLYSDAYHTYAVTWTPREIKFELDGEVFKTIAPPLPDGFLGSNQYRDCENSPWERGTFMAPMDKEFTVNFALVVGGNHIYEDGCKSGDHEKPYKDNNLKNQINFWKASESWLPTWKEDFQIESVKVWAL